MPGPLSSDAIKAMRRIETGVAAYLIAMALTEEELEEFKATRWAAIASCRMVTRVLPQPKAPWISRYWRLLWEAQ